MPPVHLGFRTRRSRTWRLPLGDGRVPCPVDGVCGVEQCLVCPDFVGYVDGAVICHHTLGPRLAVAVAESKRAVS